MTDLLGLLTWLSFLGREGSQVMSQDRYYDNTRLKDGKACLRKYFFRHQKNWTSQGFTPALAFGSAWHSAMDAIWKLLAEDPTAPTEGVAEVAYAAFLECWKENGGPDPDELGPEELAVLEPRSPMIGLEMIYNYIDERRDFFKNRTFKLLAIEQPFAVPLDPKDDTLFYVGRLDKVFEIHGGIHVGEHKTTSLYSRDFMFRANFIDSFSPNSQIDGYLHALHMLYGDKATSVWVDAALVHKKIHNAFKFIPIERQHAQLDSWLYDTRWWIDTIEANWARLAEIKDVPGDLDYMTAFPKNTESCQDYGRNCSYIGVCKMIPNPIKIGTPEGFREEAWSPFERLELEKIGLEEGK